MASRPGVGILFTGFNALGQNMRLAQVSASQYEARASCCNDNVLLLGI